jgi:chitinase
MVRATRRAGARIDTVNLLAPLEPGHLGRMAAAVRAASQQIAQPRSGSLALTPVLAHGGDLDEHDARTLSAYAARHGLAWLSLRGASPKQDISRILWRTPT